MRMHFSRITKIFLLLTLSFWLTGCDWLPNFGGGDEEVDLDTQEEGTLATGEEVTFGAAKYIPWLPWYLAAEEGVFQQYSEEYGVNITFQTGSYENLINEFVGGELKAISITNIDAFVHLIRRNVKADAILISSYSYGNDAVLIPAGGDTDIVGKTIALKENTAAHYLLERYLLKNQIGFDEVEKLWVTDESELAGYFDSGEVAAVATWNPYIQQLEQEKSASVLFDSHSVPKEIFHLILVRREVLEQQPNVGRALLATWFTVMERLQGNRRGATLDALAAAAEESRASFDSQFASIQLADNATKALSILRDRSIRKTMRHIRYFMERHELAGDVPVGQWVSYPGRTPANIHFNATPLQQFLAPPEGEAAF